MLKKIAGVLLIIAAVACAIAYVVDGRPETKPDIPATIEQIKDGASLIRGDESATKADAPAAIATEKQGESK